MSFSVLKTIKNDFEKAEFKWTVDKGKIIRGQGTSKIEVETTDLNYVVINAALEISNLPENCKNSFSESGVVADNYDPEESDQYGKLSLKDELARLDAFISHLSAAPETQGYIILSLQEKGSRKKAENHTRKLLKHFKSRAFPAERITFLLDRNRSKDVTVLWRVPKDVKYLPFTANEIIEVTNDK